MNGTRKMGWGGGLLIALVLIIAGAAAATWGLAHYRSAARFLGVVPAQQPIMLAPRPIVTSPSAQPQAQVSARQEDQEIEDLQNRVAAVENATQRAEGSAGRADALVVAFAARRAIDRGVALGYLENLLVDRFGTEHRAAVATVITVSHEPVSLDDLIGEYDALGPDLRRGGPQDSWWTNLKRELGSLVEVHSVERPASQSPGPLPTCSPAPCVGRCRSGAGRDDAASGRIARGRLGRKGPALHRSPQSARRNRIRGSSSSTQPAPLSEGLASDPQRCGSLRNEHRRFS